MYENATVGSTVGQLSNVVGDLDIAPNNIIYYYSPANLSVWIVNICYVIVKYQFISYSHKLHGKILFWQIHWKSIINRSTGKEWTRKINFIILHGIFIQDFETAQSHILQVAVSNNATFSITVSETQFGATITLFLIYTMSAWLFYRMLKVSEC